MAKIFLLTLPAPQQVSIFLEGDKQATSVLVKRLIVDDASRGLIPLKPFEVPLTRLKDDGGDNFHFIKTDTAQPFEFELEAGASISFLSLIAGAGAEVAFSLKLFIPVADSPNPPDQPFIQFRLCGRLAMFAGPLLALGNEACYELTVQEVPTFEAGDMLQLPELTLRFPKFNFRLPKLRIPNWHLPSFPTLPFKLPSLQIEPLEGATLPFVVTWESVSLSFDPVTKKTTVDVKNLRIGIKQLPQLVLRGDLRLVFTGDGKLVKDESFFKRLEPEETINLKGIFADPQCLAVNWNEPHINRLLRQLAPNLLSKDSVIKEITARVLFAPAGTLSEIRFDWAVAGAEASFALPGLEVILPDAARYSLILRSEDGGLKRFALCVTLAKGAKVNVRSSFAWMRDQERELHNDTLPEHPQDPTHLFELKAKTQKEISLALINFKLGEAGLPTFFQRLNTPIGALDLSNPDSLKVLADLAATGLTLDDWVIEEFNVRAEEYILPFLRLAKEVGEKVNQFIKVFKSAAADLPLHIDYTNKRIEFPLSVRVGIGDFTLETETYLALNWETFALDVVHSSGIEIYSVNPQLGSDKETLGLSWRFKGHEKEIEVTITQTNPDGSTEEIKKKVKRFHYFTINTANHNYRLAQAEGSRFEVLFTKASRADSPIIFDITEFALMPKGINLTATVVDSPVRLNGIDTKFRFQGSQLILKENQFNSLTLSGSGPLPPDLVGEATADISLQFAQVNGDLTLVRGYAKLKGQKLLKCQQTRFQFSIDAIGLEFRFIERKFHLYFTLTGSAEFVPAGGDDANWALALLGKIKIDLVEAPLTGDARVLARHIEFLVNLPTPKSFNFLGCFQMELRGIGFVPQADVFGGDPAMILTGQVKFAQGPGDTPDGRIDYHRLFIGFPEPGSLLPRIHFKELPLNLNLGAAFRLNGVVEFFDNPLEKGFSGEGQVQIQGLPTLAASFSFLRVRENENSPWLRAWFIYLEVRQVSFMIPVLQIYIREIGFGFGYRYTIASIKKADEETDIRKLLKELKKLSRTQGDLSKRDRWAVDLEKGGLDPRWTIVFRALISQTSASPSPLSYNAQQEANLACIFLFDAIVALRSDLTFFMSARAWINTNYHDFFTNRGGISERPLLSGFVLLSPRQKRFLAHVASNPDGQLGSHPDLPEFIKKAISGAQFSATLLIEPGLLHYEMGWPNMLRWDGDIFGILKAEFRGGFIFRISRQELVIGTSFLARASLRIQAELDLGFFGVRVSAGADAAFGARYIGVVDFRDPLGQSAVYGAIGLELRIFISIEAWIHIELFLCSIDITFRFSLSIGFTAGLEIGLAGLSPTDWGLRGNGTLSLSVLGHDLQIGVRIGINEGKVALARARTERFLQIGLEATDVESVPGIEPQALLARNNGGQGDAPSLGGQPLNALANVLAPPAEGTDEQAGNKSAAENALADVVEKFEIPGYSVFVIRTPNNEGWKYFVLFPQGRMKVEGGEKQEIGFLPVPPAPLTTVANDFEITFGELGGISGLQQFTPISQAWEDVPALATGGFQRQWKVKWDASRFTIKQAVKIDQGDGEIGNTGTLKDYLELAFVPEKRDGNKLIPTRDPKPLPEAVPVEDARVHNPTDAAFEAAVRGALEQFEGSPHFKKDLQVEYEQLLDAAFQDSTTIYSPDGKMPQVTAVDEGTLSQEQKEQLKAAQREILQEQQAWHIRGMIVQEMIGDVKLHAEGALSPADMNKSVPFGMGLVFRFKGDGVALDRAPIKLKQRNKRDAVNPDPKEVEARVFNIAATSFAVNRPKLERLRFHTSSSTVGITWDLTWDKKALDEATTLPFFEAQKEPEHHLLHYRMQRKCLDGEEPDAEYTVKNADALHRVGESILKRLKWRFQIVDHFKETAEDRQALPEEGRSYLYTITPIDVAGDAGDSISIVVTRRPDAPPLVPNDAKLIVEYEILPENFIPEDVSGGETPSLLQPLKVSVEWSQQSTIGEQTTPAVAERWLIFRREQTLPIGSYSLDSATQRARNKSLPTSNARPLPTDVKIKLGAVSIKSGEEDDREQNLVEAVVDLKDQNNIFPGGGEAWQPEAWRVFLQTVSVNGVASALAPVQIQLNLATADEKETDERQPAELEWLPRSTRLPILPVEDERAVTGAAHVPMPDTGLLTFPEDGLDLKQRIKFKPHPAGLRCIRFRWNQGPSARPGYPLELTAGYHILELDADAHTTEIFEQPNIPDSALRTIQDAQMLPPDDLVLTPNDTLNTSQWEAWYPSTVLRLKPPEQAQELESTNRQGPWYSWRESYLEWPVWPGFTDAEGRRSAPLHLFLQEFLYALTDDPLGRSVQAENPLFYKDLLPPLNADLQTSPPMQPGNLTAFFKATARESDSYGWSVLQRFGLAMAFSLRYSQKTIVDGQVRQEGDVVSGEELLKALSYARKKYAKEFLILKLTREAIDELEPKLKVLIPDIKIRLTRIENKLFEGRLKFSQALTQQVGEENLRKMAGPEGQKQPVAVIINRAARGEVTFDSFFKHLHFELLFQPGRSIELSEAEEVAPESLLALIQLSLRPAIKQRLRYGKLVINKQTLGLKPEDEGLGGAEISVTYEMPQPPPDGIQSLQLSVVNLAEPDSTQNEINLSPDKGIETSFQMPSNGEATLLFRGERMPTVKIKRKAEQGDGKEVEINPVLATDEASRHFQTDSDELAAHFLSDKDMASHWRLFKLYAESLNSTDKEVQADSRIAVPLDMLDKLKETLPDYIAWSQRFFDSGGEVKEIAGSAGLGQTGAGPWIATAYPRAGAPLMIAPDASGRLTYDHLVSDDWAHNYRYYIRPYGRYEMLWDSLRRKDIFHAPEKALPPVLPKKNAGGLDVVLDRQHPVAMPLILSSRRLDEPSTSQKLAPPGKTWEVIVAEHAEQSLIERNQTLARQMAFRGVAFTLLRRFAFSSWKKDLETALGSGKVIDIEPVEDKFSEAPQAYPDIPDQLNLADEEDLRSVALPQRVRNFQQGSLVLQWKGLPFYYEHCLLLVAQTASNVSAVNKIVQKDFEYRSPNPKQALIEGSGNLPAQRLTRVLQIPLHPFWESLSIEAQGSWPSENPSSVSTINKRLLSSLPDIEVVYQIFETFSGNVEVQTEIFVGKKKTADGQEVSEYMPRQLGKRWTAKGVRLLPPPPKLKGEPPQFEDDPQGDFIIEVMLEYNEEEVERFRPYVSSRVTLPDELGQLVTQIKPTDYALIWFGVMSPEEKIELLKLKGDAPFLAALVRLATTALKQGEEDMATEVIPLSMEQVASDVSDARGRLSLLPDGGQIIQQLAWTGALEPAQDERLKNLSEQKPFSEAVAQLLDRVKTRQVSRDIPEGLVIDPPPALVAAQLKIESKKVTWTGQVTAAQLDALKALTGPVDYVTAVNQIVSVLETTPVIVDFIESRRPEQKDLPAILRDKLLLGKERLEIKALLRSSQANKLREVFSEKADIKAINRFYSESVLGSLKRKFGSELKVRTRRGSAPVSESPIPVTLKPIQEKGSEN